MYNIMKIVNVPVRYLKASMGVRYWEDATLNGQPRFEEDDFPLRKFDTWNITIDLHTGHILNWPLGTDASVHFKVCDDGVYSLLDENMNEVVTKEGYVPSMIGEYGDYVVLDIDQNGYIKNFEVDLDYFINED